jgi:hypothetical protein
VSNRRARLLRFRRSALPPSVGFHFEIDEFFPLLESESRGEVGSPPPTLENAGKTDGTPPQRKDLAGKRS